MRVDGRCHCGALTFTGEVDPETCGICHCTDCQNLTGSAYRVTVRASAATFVLHGEPTVYVKTAESGTQRAHAFCPTCGTPIYATAATPNPTVYSLRVGTLRQRRDLPPPRQQTWCRSALPWSMDIERIEGHDRGAPS
jgi:hypothetical protein